MAQATGEPEPTGLRLGEGEFPLELDRVNYGAFLLAFIWAPFHRLWGWFVVFAVLEGLESAIGLSAPRFLGGLFERPAAMVVFRIVYWALTVLFALRANRLLWTLERERLSRPKRDSVLRRPSLVSRYDSNQRVWALVGLVLLITAPLSLLISAVSSVPGAVGDVGLAPFAVPLSELGPPMSLHRS